MSIPIGNVPRPSPDFPALGFDPAPGEVWEVNSLARTLQNAAATLGQVDDLLYGAGDGAWRGETAEAFRALMADELRPKIRTAKDAFSDAQTTIANWSEDLADFQRRARSLERQAQDAQDQITAAESNVDRLPRPPAPFGFPATPEERADRERDQNTREAAEGVVDAARELLESIRDLAEALWEEYLERARDRARELEECVDAAPNKPGLLDRALDALGDLVGAVGELIAAIGELALELLEDLAPFLRILAKALGFISAVLGILSLAIPALAPFALAAAGLSMLAHYGAAAGETGSFLEAFKDPQFLMSAVSVVLGGTSMAIGAALRSSVNAASGVAGAARIPAPGFFQALRGAGPTLTNTQAFFVGFKGALDGAGQLLNVKTVFDTGFEIGQGLGKAFA